MVLGSWRFPVCKNISRHFTGCSEVSYDGTTYERAGDLEKGSITLKPGRPVKAVRIVSTCDDNGTPYVTIQPPQIKPVL